MLCVRRNEDVGADVYAGAGAFLKGDNRKAVKEVMYDLFAFGSGLLGAAIANLSRWRQNASFMSDLREAA